MKKIILLLCAVHLGTLVSVQKNRATGSIGHSPQETATIKKYFSQQYLKDHAKTFDTKILPRLELYTDARGKKLIYRHMEHGTIANIKLAPCRMGTVKLDLKEPKFSCKRK